jgi:hypothetical protein
MEMMLPLFIVFAFGAALFLVCAPILLVGVALLHPSPAVWDRVGMHCGVSLLIGAISLLLAVGLLWMIGAPFAMGR